MRCDYCPKRPNIEPKRNVPLFSWKRGTFLIEKRHISTRKEAHFSWKRGAFLKGGIKIG